MEAERAAFEEWALAAGYDTTRGEAREYRSQRTCDAWAGYGAWEPERRGGGRGGSARAYLCGPRKVLDK